MESLKELNDFVADYKKNAADAKATAKQDATIAKLGGAVEAATSLLSTINDKDTTDIQKAEVTFNLVSSVLDLMVASGVLPGGVTQVVAVAGIIGKVIFAFVKPAPKVESKEDPTITAMKVLFDRMEAKLNEIPVKVIKEINEQKLDVADVTLETLLTNYKTFLNQTDEEQKKVDFTRMLADLTSVQNTLREAMKSIDRFANNGENSKFNYADAQGAFQLLPRFYDTSTKYVVLAATKILPAAQQNAKDNYTVAAQADLLKVFMSDMKTSFDKLLFGVNKSAVMFKVQFHCLQKVLFHYRKLFNCPKMWDESCFALRDRNAFLEYDRSDRGVYLVPADLQKDVTFCKNKELNLTDLKFWGINLEGDEEATYLRIADGSIDRNVYGISKKVTTKMNGTIEESDSPKVFETQYIKDNPNIDDTGKKRNKCGLVIGVEFVGVIDVYKRHNTRWTIETKQSAEGAILIALKLDNFYSYSDPNAVGAAKEVAAVAGYMWLGPVGYLTKMALDAVVDDSHYHVVKQSNPKCYLNVDGNVEGTAENKQWYYMVPYNFNREI